MFKRIVSLFLVIISICSIGFFSSHALDYDEPIDEPIEPEFETIQFSDIGLSSRLGKAVITVSIGGNTGTKFKNGTIKLYKYVNGAWTTQKTWSNLSSSTNTFIFNNNSLTIQSGTIYKVKLTITAYNSSTTEPLTLSTTKTL